MCLIIFSWNPSSKRPLILGANRDEFHQRPSQDAHFWPDAPHIFAGRDLKMMGTWLGVSKHSASPSFRMAALTNVRRPNPKKYPRSRGELPRHFLESEESALAYAQNIPLAEFAGFNGLFYDGSALVYIHHDIKGATEILELAPGNYALSNARLDTPWPKVQKTRRALHEIKTSHSAQEIANLLFSYLEDPRIAEDSELPDTGVGLALERMLSAAFIVSPGYGTRTSSALILEQEQMPGSPSGSQQTAWYVEHQFLADGSRDRSLSQKLT